MKFWSQVTISPRPPKKIEGIVTLRALSILLVLLSHSRTLFEKIDNTWWHFGGHFGVIFFFGISGFLLAQSLDTRNEYENILDKKIIITGIILSRILRIYIPYLVVLSGLFFMYRFDPRYILFLQWTDVRHSYYSLFPVSWSLVIEIYFYLTPLLLFILNIRSLVLTLFLVSLISSWVLMMIGWNYPLRLNPFGFEYLATGMIAYYGRQYFKRSHALLITLSACLFYLALLAYFGRDLVLLKISDLFLVLTVVMLSSRVGVNPKNIIIKTLRPISVISFSLYLTHYEVFRILKNGNFTLFADPHPGILFFPLSLVIGTIFYYSIERPSHNFSRYIRKKILMRLC